MLQWTAPHPCTYHYTEIVLTRLGESKKKGMKLRGRWAEDMGRVGKLGSSNDHIQCVSVWNCQE